VSLKEDIEKWFDGTTKWPGDLDGDGEGQVDCVMLSDEIVDTSRWAVIHEAVYLRKTISGRDPLTFSDEYVRVTYREPATENQDWGDEGPPDIEEVVPVEVTITKFEVKA
jgi:hypothetical protein